MQAWINGRTGAADPVPGGAPVGPSTAPRDSDPHVSEQYGSEDAQVTPPPKRITLKGLAVVDGAAGASAETATTGSGPDMVVLPAAAAAAALAPPIVASAGRLSVAGGPVAARPQTMPQHRMPQTMPQTTIAGQLPAGEEDPSFSDQVMRWMQQGDRIEEARARKPIDLSDLSEPTDPVAHELFEMNLSVPRETQTQARRRWLAVGAFAVVASIGLYWAARDPRQGDPGSAVSASTAAASTSAIARLARTPDPNAPGAILAATPPPVAAVAAKAPDEQAAALADRAHNHRGAGRLHHRRHH